MARRRPKTQPGFKGIAGLFAALFVTVLFFGLSGALQGIIDLQPQLERLSERQATYTAWDAEKYPDYYRVVGTAVVDVELEPGEVVYEGLDLLGRTGRVAGSVTLDMAREGSEREREDISDIHPSGWGHNREVQPQPPAR